MSERKTRQMWTARDWEQGTSSVNTAHVVTTPHRDHWKQPVPVLVTEIPATALPVPEFEVGQRVRNEKSGVLENIDGPPFWSDRYRCWKVPTRYGGTWLCADVRPHPSTVTKTIRVTGSESDVDAAILGMSADVKVDVGGES